VTGEDVTPRQIVIETTGIVVPIFTGTQQIHVTADVAHAVWHYWRATRDDAFLASCGAEMLVETARFWASRAVERDGAHHIDRVVGPDEYHHDVNDNAYTNWMAKENLRAAVDALGWLETHAPRAHGELTARLGVGRHHVERWQDVAARLYIPAPDARGVIEQFAGFFDLQEVPLPAGERLRAPISRLMDWETINRTKICKQADVLMIPFLFPAVLPPDVVKACFHYYEPITDHGSSLSPAVHAAVAARLGLRDRALDYWETSLLLDLENRMGNTALGFHVASAGGAWQALIFHLLGLRFEEGRIERDSRLTPVLPDGCSAVRGRLVHRGRHLPFDVRPQEEREGRP
jgi:trehalose/maltose hydrolase-like predicted phosphorylase